MVVKKRVSARSNGSRRNLLLAIGAGVGLITAVWGFSGGEREVCFTVEEAKSALTEDNLTELQALPAEERKKAMYAYGKAISADFVARHPEGLLRGPRPEGERKQDNPGGLAEPTRPEQELRKVVDKLSPEDRDAFREGMHSNMRKQFEKEMNAKLEEFFNATPEEQERLLAEEVARMKARVEQRKKDEAEGKRHGPPPGFRNQQREKREEHMRGRLDNSDPATRAKRDEYFARLRQAMETSK